MKQKPALFFQWFFTHPVIAAINITMGILLILVGCGIFALNQTKQMAIQLEMGNLESAQSSAKMSLPIVQFFNAITLFRIPDFAVWEVALKIPASIEKVVTSTEEIAEQFEVEKTADLNKLSEPISVLHQHIQVINQTLPKTYFLNSELSVDQVKKITTSLSILTNTQTILDSISEGNQTWIVLLQNTDELRATGGFPGSYALINLTDGQITEVVIEDIYDADGQFKGYIPAPPGIREYTSSNNGLRLPDANWSPDFPASAQTMLQFFALGDKQQVRGLIAINSSLISSLLTITGPVELPDYDITLSSENMRQVLRSERGSFFPGSNQKKFILNQAFTQFQRKLANLESNKKIALFSQLKKSLELKDIQVYSPQPDLEKIFTQLNIAGALTIDETERIGCDCEPISVMLVESNVGINKVNPFVSRSVEITLEPNSATVKTEFTNDAAPMSATELSSLLATSSAMPAPRNGNGYLNYYRMIISPQFIPKEISINGNKISNWDDELVVFQDGKHLRQIGFLVGVAEQRSVNTVVILETKQAETATTLKLFKQSGLSNTNYTVSWLGNTDHFILERDTVLNR